VCWLGRKGDGVFTSSRVIDLCAYYPGIHSTAVVLSEESQKSDMYVNMGHYTTTLPSGRIRLISSDCPHIRSIISRSSSL